MRSIERPRGCVRAVNKGMRPEVAHSGAKHVLLNRRYSTKALTKKTIMFNNEVLPSWAVLLIVVLIIAGLVLYYNKVKKDQVELKKKEHDAYSHVVNDSNYNINREGIDGHRSEGLSKEEAQHQVQTLKETNQIPSREEFNDLQKDLKK